MQSTLADDQHGMFSWIWMLNTHTDDELLEHCGLDALCFLRTLSMGYRICALGMFNAFWLLPLYYTCETTSDTVSVTDPVAQLTTANVPKQSPRLVGTALAAYILFGYTMHLILQEFKWFTEMRHKFLRKQLPRNYTVYVRNIPVQYRSNAGLLKFFGKCLGEERVVDARVRVTAANLTKQVQKREQAILNLENAIAMEEYLGITTHKSGLLPVGGTEVNSIECE